MNYKEEIKKCLNDLKSRKTFYKQIPNIITMIRIIGVIPLNILYLMGNIPMALIVGGIIFLSDFVDGKIARKYNITSSFGADLDAVSDKVLALGLCIPLMISNPLLIISFLLEFMISAVNVTSKIKGYNPESNYIGKAKTWLLSLTLLVGYLKNIKNIPNLIFNILIFVTAGMESLALHKYIDSYRKSKNNYETLKEINENEIKKEQKEFEMDKIEYLKRERENILGMNISDKKKTYSRKKKR